jgi:hypothetical protein
MRKRQRLRRSESRESWRERRGRSRSRNWRKKRHFNQEKIQRRDVLLILLSRHLETTN